MDVVVLKYRDIPWRDIGEEHDYCLVKSEPANVDRSPMESSQLSNHANDNIYRITFNGLRIRFSRVDGEVSTPLSGYLHLQDNVGVVTGLFENMKSLSPREAAE